MPSLNSPWYQQRRSDSATPPEPKPKAASSMSAEEQEALTLRLSKPTESAKQRRSLFWKMDTFLEAGRHSWSKMELFEDCKRCMWTPTGSVKTNSCKIRPIKPIPRIKGPAPGI